MLQTTYQTENLSGVAQLAEQAIKRASTLSKVGRERLAHIDISVFPSTGNEKEVTTRPYGFDVHKAYREYLQDKAHIEYLEMVAELADHAAQICKRDGIPVMAILPERAWSKICKDAGLFTLIPSEKGEVRVSRKALEEAIRAATHNISEKTWFGSSKSYERLKYERAVVERDTIQHFFRGRKADVLMRELFPNYISLGQHDYYGSDEIQVEFPVPDANFGLALLGLKKSRYQARIVVEPEAIDVSGYARELLKKANEAIQRANEALEISLRRAADPCPILTTLFTSQRDPKKSAGVCVIIAQYGNWPIELKTIETALENDLQRSV